MHLLDILIWGWLLGLVQSLPTSDLHFRPWWNSDFWIEKRVDSRGGIVEVKRINYKQCDEQERLTLSGTVATVFAMTKEMETTFEKDNRYVQLSGQLILYHPNG